MNFVILIIAAYLLGSIPFSLIIARAYGKDLRKIGSGNIGATNLSRAVGKKWAYFCFLLDVSKSLVPMLIVRQFISTSPSVCEFFLWLAVGTAAVLGHIFPLYTKFKGGKGVATSFGVALGLWPYYTVCAAIAFTVWLISLLIWRYISLGSIIAAIFFPIILAILIVLTKWNFSELWPLFIVSTMIPPLVVTRHRDNIKRIIAGTEHKVFTK